MPPRRPTLVSAPCRRAQACRNDVASWTASSNGTAAPRAAACSAAPSPKASGSGGRSPCVYVTAVDYIHPIPGCMSGRIPPAVTPSLLDLGLRARALGREIRCWPGRPEFTKLDLVRYYLAVAEGALRGAGGRPNMLVRYPDGIGGEFFYQKRAPRSRPPWIEVVSLRFPSGRSADEVVPRHAAALAWMANLACLELHPHPVRADDLDHPDELRVDLDPVPGVGWPQIREVAQVVHATLTDLGLVGWPKTSV